MSKVTGALGKQCCFRTEGAEAKKGTGDMCGRVCPGPLPSVSQSDGFKD